MQWVKEARGDSRGDYWTLQEKGDVLVSMAAGVRQGEVHYDFRVDDQTLAERAGMVPGRFTLDAKGPHGNYGAYMDENEVKEFFNELGLKNRPHYRESARNLLD